MTLKTPALLTTSLAALLLAACGGEASEAPAQSRQTAEQAASADEPVDQQVIEAEAESVEEENPLAAIPAGTYVVDPGHAYITMSYSHLGMSHPVLRFDSFDATAEVNPDAPAASTLRVEIDPTSINSAVEKFDEHLQSADMFDVAQYPEITFVSTGIEMESATSGTLTGDLTMKGVTRPVTLDVTLNGAGMHPMAEIPAFGISATGTLDRTEWNLGYAVPNVGAEVDLRIEAEFQQAQDEAE
ncbi:YceI family protein [Parvularcula dongshanensis]|uniref:Polyisoprenoid-binding protein YceI n=1 Tax=Parvularcula dongshanensis TaxID=1173995 RepID=A0A840I4F9_9PROT|nr:YceI family protein [Parvularcula dongshanensis]MBB4659667.1 polyisoprenoid-binding protein YceI [Parvularcula dongshanensis]